MQMTNAQKALGASILGAMALAVLHVWLFEAMVGGSYPDRAIERLLL